MALSPAQRERMVANKAAAAVRRAEASLRAVRGDGGGVVDEGAELAVLRDFEKAARAVIDSLQGERHGVGAALTMAQSDARRLTDELQVARCAEAQAKSERDGARAEPVLLWGVRAELEKVPRR